MQWQAEHSEAVFAIYLRGEWVGWACDLEHVRKAHQFLRRPA